MEAVLIKGSLPPGLQKAIDAVSDQAKTKLSESLRKGLVLMAPRNREELWFMVAHRWKMGISRKALCPDHDPPLDFLDRAYFQTDEALFAKAAKGTGKTIGFSMLHELNGSYKPGIWAAHVGAIEKQTRICWNYIEQHMKDEGLIGKAVDPFLYEVALSGEPLRSDVRWRNGSRLELLAGTLGQVSGPHPNVAAADEFELINWEVWEHLSKTIQTTIAARAQLVLGSTHFRLGGPVERVLNPPDGRKSPFKIVQWCVWESIARCEYDCMDVPGYGKCPLWSRMEVKPDGTVEEVPMCHGRAHEADGHMDPRALMLQYLASASIDDWATIMELRKPSKRGAFFPEFEESRHVKKEYEYVPGQPVFLGFDDGFAYPYCLGAWQERTDGFLYQFDEIYGTHKTTDDIIVDMASREWIVDVAPAEDLGGWPDPSARNAIETFNRWFVANAAIAKRADGRPVMRWDTDNDRKQGWKSVRGRLFGVTGRATIGWHPRCANTYGDLKGLRQKVNDEDCIKEDDHGADMVRYLVFNRDKRLGRRGQWDESRRPDGELETMRRLNQQQAEVQVKERWDLLVKRGHRESELRVIESRFGEDRVELARALGGLLTDQTMKGRMQRAGLAVADDDDEPDRPGGDEEE